MEPHRFGQCEGRLTADPARQPRLGQCSGMTPDAYATRTCKAYDSSMQSFSRTTEPLGSKVKTR